MGNNCKRCFGIHVENKGQYVRASYNMNKDVSFEFEQLVEDDFLADDLRLTTSLDPANTPFTVSNYMQWLSAQEEALREVEESQQFPTINRNNDLHQEISLSSSDSRAFDGSTTDCKGNRLNDRNCCKELNIVECRTGSRPNPVGVVSDWVLREGWNAASMGSEEELDGAELSRVLDDVRNVELGLSSRQGLWASLGTSNLPGNLPGLPTDVETIPDRETIKINSMQAKIHQHLTNGSRHRDVNSISSTREAPSLDLDWDHEPGMNPGVANLQRSATEEDLRVVVDQPIRRDSISSSEDYLWEHDDFVNGACIDKRHLLT